MSQLLQSSGIRLFRTTSIRTSRPSRSIPTPAFFWKKCWPTNGRASSGKNFVLPAAMTTKKRKIKRITSGIECLNFRSIRISERLS